MSAALESARAVLDDCAASAGLFLDAACGAQFAAEIARGLAAAEGVPITVLAWLRTGAAPRFLDDLGIDHATPGWAQPSCSLLHEREAELAEAFLAAAGPVAAATGAAVLRPAAREWRFAARSVSGRRALNAIVVRAQALPANPEWLAFAKARVDLAIVDAGPDWERVVREGLAPLLREGLVGALALRMEAAAEGGPFRVADGEPRAIALAVPPLVQAGVDLGVELRALRDEVHAHRLARLLRAARLELQFEIERIEAALEVRERAARGVPRRGARGDDEMARLKQQARSLGDKALDTLEGDLSLDDLGLAPEQLVVRLADADLERREHNSYVVRNTPGATTFLSAWRTRKFFVSVRPEFLEETRERIARAGAKQMDRDAAAHDQVAAAIERDTLEAAGRVLGGRRQPPELALPRLEKGACRAVGERITVDFSREETLVRPGLFSFFLQGQSIGMRLMMVTGLLVSSVGSVAAVMSMLAGPEEALRPAGMVRLTVIVVAVAVAVLVFRWRMLPGEQEERIGEIRIALREKLLSALEGDLRALNSERARIHKAHLRRVREALDRYWYQVDDLAKRLADEEDARVAEAERVAQRAVAALKERAARARALLGKLAQAGAALGDPAASALARLQASLLSAVHAQDARTATADPVPTSPVAQPPATAAAGAPARATPPARRPLTFPSRPQGAA